MCVCGGGGGSAVGKVGGERGLGGGREIENDVGVGVGEGGENAVGEVGGGRDEVGGRGLER